MTERTLVLATGCLLLRAGARLMLAESCTGGLLSQWVTAAGGSSAWFDGAVVSYSNAIKREVLGVRPETLSLHGAVSCETAGEMVAGLGRLHRRALENAQGAAAEQLLGISVTGIAGPMGAVPGKPVGTACFGWAGPWGVVTGRRHFDGDRDAIRQQAAEWALTVLISHAASARMCS